MLELRNITKTFGSVVANNDVSIKIEKGTIHAIVGENGAGKSTIMRIAYGFYTADSGEILVDGKHVQIRNPHDAIALGIGMVHQHFMLVDTMTVAENIILGAETGDAANLDLEKANRDIQTLSDELRLGVNPRALIEDLSVGAQQRVELLKALYRRAELLILDEPTAVLTPQEVEEFFGILRRMREQGKTIVIITHKLEEVLAISDDVTVMRDGKTVGAVKTADTSAKDLARMIVGRDVLLRVEKTDAKPAEDVLKVQNLSVVGKHGLALDDVSFNVRAGEIVGIAGIEGNGQTELIETLAGLQQPTRGEIVFQGTQLDYFDRSTAPALRRLLIAMLIVFPIIDIAFFLITTEKFPFMSAIITVVVRIVIFLTLFFALKNRSKLASYFIIGASSLVLLVALTSLLYYGFQIGFGPLFNLALTNFVPTALALIEAAFLIAAIVLANRTLKEFNSPEKNEYNGLTARRRKELGIAHIPEDRHKRGLLLDSDLEENSILGVHYRPPVTGSGFLNSRMIENRTKEIIKNFDVRPPNPELAAKSLSGGNQQKLIIGREFELNPKLLLVSQPTRGVDIGAIEFIHRKLIDLRDAGGAVLLVSAELEEVTALADRLLVIYKGKFVGGVDPKVVSTEEIGLMMTGMDTESKTR